MTDALRNYAMIGDCRTAAMISHHGSIDWLCLPDFSSPSLFCRLLDTHKGGHFSISIAGITHAERRYLPQTAILETTLSSAEGSIRITDCMPIPSDARHYPDLQPLREILRLVEVVSGHPTITVQCSPKPDYARTECRIINRKKLGWIFNYNSTLLNLITDFPLQQTGSAVTGISQTEAGQRFWFSLTMDSGSPRVLLPIGDEAQKRLQMTTHWWRNWCRGCTYHGPWEEQVIRSAITLRMLAFTQSGAVLAAATTSLPERPHGWMNWDYRYCWPRDSAVTISAFMHVGFVKETGAFFDWIMLAANTTRPRLNNMYDIYGHSNINEKLLPWLSGYGGAKPVRVGNVLTKQVQHDVYGEVMMAMENWHNLAIRLEPDAYALMQGFADVVAKEWREPDNGIWEIRGKRKHYTYSKVMAWYVFDCLIRLHERGTIFGKVDFYRKERDALRDAIEYQGFNAKRNCYTAVFGGDVTDASLLLMPRCGYIDYNDPRMQGTWQAILEDLEYKNIILRYPPGFGGSQPGEGAFIICNFWAVNYLTGSGRYEEAEERLIRLIRLGNDVGLYCEGVDVESGEPLGNMPQAYSHAGLITAITRLYADKGGISAATSELQRISKPSTESAGFAPRSERDARPLQASKRYIPCIH